MPHVIEPGRYRLVPAVNHASPNYSPVYKIMTAPPSTTLISGSWLHIPNIALKAPSGVHDLADVISRDEISSGSLFLLPQMGPEVIVNAAANTPAGSIAIAVAYVLLPLGDGRLDANPGLTRLSGIDLKVENRSAVDVEGSCIRIGDFTLDLGNGSDFTIDDYRIDGVPASRGQTLESDSGDIQKMTHVIRAGSQLHSLLVEERSRVTDHHGIGCNFDYEPSMAQRVEDLGTEDASAVARLIRHPVPEAFYGKCSLHLHYHFDDDPRA